MHISGLHGTEAIVRSTVCLTELRAARPLLVQPTCNARGTGNASVHSAADRDALDRHRLEPPLRFRAEMLPDRPLGPRARNRIEHDLLALQHDSEPSLSEEPSHARQSMRVHLKARCPVRRCRGGAIALWERVPSGVGVLGAIDRRVSAAGTTDSVS